MVGAGKRNVKKRWSGANNNDISDEENEFNEEDWEEEDEEEEQECVEEDDDNSTEQEGSNSSASQSNHTGSAERSVDSGEEEGDEDEEEDEDDYEDATEGYNDEEEEGKNSGHDVDDVAHEKDNADTAVTAQYAPSFNFAAASSPPVLASSAFASAGHPPSAGAPTSIAAASSAFGQAAAWPLATATVNGSSSAFTSFRQPTPSASPPPAFFTGAPAAAAPGSAGVEEGVPYHSAEGATPASSKMTQPPFPAPPTSAQLLPPHKTAHQEGAAAAISLQFVDFKCSFGQALRRTRSAAEEAQEVKTSLARYELVVPTDRFDKQIERALYGC
jgi:hypothetical protein